MRTLILILIPWFLTTPIIIYSSFLAVPSVDAQWHYKEAGESDSTVEPKSVASIASEYNNIIRDAEAIVKKYKDKLDDLQRDCPHPLERQRLHCSLPGLSVHEDIICEDCGLDRPGWLPRKQFVPKSVDTPFGMRDTTEAEHAAMRKYVESIRSVRDKYE